MHRLNGLLRGLNTLLEERSRAQPHDEDRDDPRAKLREKLPPVDALLDAFHDADAHHAARDALRGRRGRPYCAATMITTAVISSAQNPRDAVIVATSIPITRVTRLPYVARPMTSDAAESTKIQYSAVTELGNDTSLGWL